MARLKYKSSDGIWKSLSSVSLNQGSIPDLDEIRSGAALGATALQSVPSEYVTETELSGKGYATTSSMNTELAKKQDTISDLAAIRSGAALGATALQSYTEKYTGTYSKPSGGIPKSDLAEDVRTSLGKADTALQSYTETDPVFKASAAAGITSSDIANWNGKTSNAGTITGIKMNGVSKGTSGVVDLGTVITAHQDISGKLDKTEAASTYLTKTDASSTYLGKTAKAADATKADSATKATQDASGNVITSTYATKTEIAAKQDKNLYFTNMSASDWVSDSTYADFPYRCDVACSGVTADMYAEVVFDAVESASGNYASVCETKSGVVSIWGKNNTTITIPTIIIEK